MTLNPQKSGFVEYFAFLAAAHISTVNCDEMAGDRPRQPANRNCQVVGAVMRLMSFAQITCFMDQRITYITGGIDRMCRRACALQGFDCTPMLYTYSGGAIKYVSKLDDSDSKQQQGGKVSYVYLLHVINYKHPECAVFSSPRLMMDWDLIQILPPKSYLLFFINM